MTSTDLKNRKARTSLIRKFNNKSINNDDDDDDDDDADNSNNNNINSNNNNNNNVKELEKSQNNRT